MKMCNSRSFVHKMALVAADWLPQVRIILRVFIAIFTTFLFGVSPIKWHVIYITLLLIIYM